MLFQFGFKYRPLLYFLKAVSKKNLFFIRHHLNTQDLNPLDTFIYFSINFCHGGASGEREDDCNKEAKVAPVPKRLKIPDIHEKKNAKLNIVSLHKFLLDLFLLFGIIVGLFF